MASEHDVLGILGENYHGPWQFVLHAVHTPVLYIALSGLAVAGLFYLIAPSIPAFLDSKLGFLRRILDNKYGFDD